MDGDVPSPELEPRANPRALPDFPADYRALLERRMAALQRHPTPPRHLQLLLQELPASDAPLSAVQRWVFRADRTAWETLIKPHMQNAVLDAMTQEAGTMVNAVGAAPVTVRDRVERIRSLGPLLRAEVAIQLLLDVFRIGTWSREDRYAEVRKQAEARAIAIEKLLAAHVAREVKPGGAGGIWHKLGETLAGPQPPYVQRITATRTPLSFALYRFYQAGLQEDLAPSARMHGMAREWRSVQALLAPYLEAVLESTKSIAVLRDPHVLPILARAKELQPKTERQETRQQFAAKAWHLRPLRLEQLRAGDALRSLDPRAHGNQTPLALPVVVIEVAQDQKTRWRAGLVDVHEQGEIVFATLWMLQERRGGEKIGWLPLQRARVTVELQARAGEPAPYGPRTASVWDTRVVDYLHYDPRMRDLQNVPLKPWYRQAGITDFTQQSDETRSALIAHTVRALRVLQQYAPEQVPRIVSYDDELDPDADWHHHLPTYEVVPVQYTLQSRGDESGLYATFRLGFMENHHLNEKQIYAVYDWISEQTVPHIVGRFWLARDAVRTWSYRAETEPNVTYRGTAEDLMHGEMRPFLWDKGHAKKPVPLPPLMQEGLQQLMAQAGRA